MNIDINLQRTASYQVKTKNIEKDLTSKVLDHRENILKIILVDTPTLNYISVNMDSRKIGSSYCTKTYDITLEPPQDTQYTWTFQIDTFNKMLQIYCNGLTVLVVSTGEGKECQKLGVADPDYIQFSDEDTISTHFRTQPGNQRKSWQRY